MTGIVIISIAGYGAAIILLLFLLVMLAVSILLLLNNDEMQVIRTMVAIRGAFAAAVLSLTLAVVTNWLTGA